MRGVGGCDGYIGIKKEKRGIVGERGMIDHKRTVGWGMAQKSHEVCYYRNFGLDQWKKK